MPGTSSAGPRDLMWLPGRFAIARLDPRADVPSWAWEGDVASVTRTGDELSIVCDETAIPSGVQSEGGWRALKIAGPMDLSIVGVLASVAAPLAEAGISVFAVSTFETDYILVRERAMHRAEGALRAAGHRILVPD